ncbi:MAG: PD40 domain-containing protein, partial [Proteobacteria bacterium]|nr:PD40 domain-containing protein [Pseudomonadota bacterium]
MLTGSLPFPPERSPFGKDDSEELASSAVRSLNPNVPIQLEKICLKCLARNPADRFSTAQEMADRLYGFVQRSSGKPSKGVGVVVAIALASVLIGSVAVLWWFPPWDNSIRPEATRPDHQKVSQSPVWTIRLKDGHETSVRFSPDGKHILSGGLDNIMRLRSAETCVEEKLFVGHENWLRCVAYSPDGRYVASCSGGTG